MKNPARTILITGAGSGLGRALSVCLAQEGHTILATDLRLDTARETVARSKPPGARRKPMRST